jgi:hypothetical protein
MKVTSGLVLVATVMSIAACGGTTAPSAPSPGAPLPLIATSQAATSQAATSQAATSQAATSQAAAACQVQVQSWTAATFMAAQHQVEAEFSQLAKDAYTNPSNLPADAGPIMATAEQFAPQKPPRCASNSLSRDWADYIAGLTELAHYLKLNAGRLTLLSGALNVAQALITMGKFWNSATLGLRRDLVAYGESYPPNVTVVQVP